MKVNETPGTKTYSFRHTLLSYIKQPWPTILILVYMAAMIAVSIPKSQILTEQSDHWIVWQAGKDFYNHHELYYRKQIRPYTLTPFAAFVFQPLHIIPLKISANILFLLNSLVLLPLAISLIFKMLINIGVKPRKALFVLALSVLFTLKYFWNNLIMFQLNYVIFVVSLAGIYYLTKRKPHVSGMLFTIIAMVKIIPVFLVAYVFIFHFSKKVASFIILTGLICLLLPVTNRGAERLINDYNTYYETFLKEYVIEGRVVTEQANHSLKAGVIKTFYPDTRNDANVDMSKYPAVSLILTIVQVLLLCLVIFNGYLLRQRKRYFSLAYVVSIILFTHLVSGLTWTAHLVTLLLCLMPVLLIEVKKLPDGYRIVYYFLMGLLLFLGIEGSDTVGNRIYLAIRYYDVFTYLLLTLFFYCSWVVWSGKSSSIYPDDIQI